MSIDLTYSIMFSLLQMSTKTTGLGVLMSKTFPAGLLYRVPQLWECRSNNNNNYINTNMEDNSPGVYVKVTKKTGKV